MIADRKDFTASLVKRHGEANARILPMARLLAGAAPIMDKLSRSDEWTRYCNYLQGVLDRFELQKAGAISKLTDPSITEDREIRKLRQDIFIADVTINTLRFAIELPVSVVKGGEEANQFVKEFEKKNENAT